jgi:PAS domain S-box-containing protein
MRLQLAAIVESSFDAIISRDLHGIVTSWNKAATQMFGWSAAEILGQPYDVLLPRGEKADVESMVEKLEHGGSVENFEAPRLHKDGRPIEVSISNSPIKDDQGNLVGVSAIMRDISEKKQLQEEILRISEHEQTRIAQDLHDGLGQELVGIFCLSDVLKKNLADQHLPHSKEAARIAKLLHSAVAQTRGLARGLLPVAPEPGGLMAALTELAGNLTNLFKIRCQFDCPEPVLLEDQTVAGHLFRIAQEAATNSVKHGRARQLTIELSSTPEMLTLAVKDDGRGFNTAEDRPKGLGLRIMNHRAGVIGGTLVIRQPNAGGTEVVCTLDQAHAKTSNGQS